jgi:hypothetical protein
MNFRKTNLHSWLEWKRTCALAKCASDVQLDIQDWAIPILRRAEKQNGATGEELEERGQLRSNGVSDAWRDLEVYCQKISGEHKKQWKDVICDMADEHPDADSQRASFEKLIRGRVRFLAKDEWRAIERERKIFPFSIDEPVSQKPDSGSFGDFCRDAPELTPDALAVWEDLCDLAAKEATLLHSQFTLREQFALGCKSKRIPLYLPEVLKGAGCGSSQLNKAFTDAEAKFQHLLTDLRAKFADESDPEDLDPFLNEVKLRLLDSCQKVVPPEIVGLSRS